MPKKLLKRAAIAVCAAAAAVIAVCSFNNGEVRAESVQDISGFLSECGISAVYASEKEITIPAEFSEVYERYNALQKEQGFDLSRHKGHCAVSYTFRATGYVDENGEPDNCVEAHVLVCDGKIVGGDIASTRLGGFMKGLR